MGFLTRFDFLQQHFGLQLNSLHIIFFTVKICNHVHRGNKVHLVSSQHQCFPGSGPYCWPQGLFELSPLLQSSSTQYCIPVLGVVGKGCPSQPRGKKNRSETQIDLKCKLSFWKRHAETTLGPPMQQVSNYKKCTE